MHDIGNCGGASVPIALADAAISGRLKPGMKVLVCAFGAGLSWGSAILEWSADFRGAFSDAGLFGFPRQAAKPTRRRLRAPVTAQKRAFLARRKTIAACASNPAGEGKIVSDMA